MKRYLRKYSRYIRYEGESLYSVGIKNDGSLYNPNNYPEDKVRAAIAWESKRIARQASAARKGYWARQARKARN